MVPINADFFGYQSTHLYKMVTHKFGWFTAFANGEGHV